MIRLVRDHKDRLVLSLAVAALVLPFSGKAMHIDDVVYWGLARMLAARGLRFYGDAFPWFGEAIPVALASRPPLIPLFLAAFQSAGGSLWLPVLHAFFSLFALAAAIAVYSLARRFTRRPLLAALLVVACPAFLVSAHDLMADVPSLAFFLAAAAAFIRDGEAEGRRPSRAAAAWTALAFLSAYQNLFLLPLLGLYAWMRKMPRRTYVLTVLPGLLLAGLFQLFIAGLGGGVHALTALCANGLNPLGDGRRAADNALGYVLALGGASVFPGVLAAGFRVGRRPWAAWALAGALALALVSLRFAEAPGASRFLFLLFAFNGLAALMGAAGRLRGLLGSLSADEAATEASAGREAFLAAWGLGYIGAAVVLLPYGVPRHLLPALAPFVFLFTEGIERLSAPRWLRGAALAGTAALGLAVAAGDYDAAEAARRLAERLVPALGPSRTWFYGEGGVRYAFMTRGAKYLMNDGRGLSDGDWVVISYPGRLDRGILERLSPAGMQTEDALWPVRTMSRDLRCDFYSGASPAFMGAGLLPFSVGGGPQLSVGLFRYRREGVYRDAGPDRAGPALASWKGGLSVLSVSARPRAPGAGEPFTLAVLWRASAPPSGALGTAVRLRGRFRTFTFLHDRGQEPFPPSRWKPGRRVREELAVPQPAPDLFPGRYEVLAAAWRGESPEEKAWKRIGTLDIEPHLRKRNAPGGRGGWTFSLVPGARLDIPLPGARSYRRLEIVSALAYSGGLPKDETVAEIQVFASSRPAAGFVLRAGRETSDLAAEAARRGGKPLAHPAAPVERCWTPAGAGPKELLCLYRWQWALPPGLVPKRLSVIDVAGSGALYIDSLSLAP